MKRLLTALALIPAVTWVILWAKYWVFLFELIAVALLCYYEYNGIAEGYGFGRLSLMGYGAGVLLLVWQAETWPLTATSTFLQRESGIAIERLQRVGLREQAWDIMRDRTR